MAEKVTVMVLKVDLQCPCCYKKVKRILCKFQQIRDQEYNEKANTVTINVVCCDPEKIRDKLCCKGYKIIKSIEIKEPPKPNGPEKTKKSEETQPTDKKTDEKDEDKETTIPKPDNGSVPDQNPPSPGQKSIPECEFPAIVPVRTCCGPCSEGYGGGPCYHGYGVPRPWPHPCYDGYYWYGYGYCHGRGCHVSRCDCYVSEENPQACSIM